MDDTNATTNATDILTFLNFFHNNLLPAIDMTCGVTYTHSGSFISTN